MQAPPGRIEVKGRYRCINLRARGVAIAIALLLSACAPRPPASPPPPAAAPERAGAVLYTVAAAESSILLKVYRDGPLARLGHNHTVAVTGLQGRVFLQPEVNRSAFELAFAATGLAVDDPADRAAAGADFPGEITADAIAGTRANMLGPKLLSADDHPLLELRTLAVRGELPDIILTVQTTVRGFSSELELPAHVEVTPATIVASGALTLSQRQLGLTPFSVLGGSLSVRDTIEASYRIVAHRADSAP